MAKKKSLSPDFAPIPLYSDLKVIRPLTDNQGATFDAFSEGKHLLLTGSSGTGKTFMSVYLALRELEANSSYNKIFIFRSVVSVRDLGFLPGTIEEKTSVFEEPYYAIFSELFHRSDAYYIYKNKDKVEFRTTSFLRGLTLNNCVIIFDEMQNCNFKEIFSLITRVGDNVRLLICGDDAQNDLRKEATGFHDLRKILSRVADVECIEFGTDDIVRGKFIKNFIIEATKLGLP